MHAMEGGAWPHVITIKTRRGTAAPAGDRGEAEHSCSAAQGRARRANSAVVMTSERLAAVRAPRPESCCEDVRANAETLKRAELESCHSVRAAPTSSAAMSVSVEDSQHPKEGVEM